MRKFLSSFLVLSLIVIVAGSNIASACGGSEGFWLTPNLFSSALEFPQFTGKTLVHVRNTGTLNVSYEITKGTTTIGGVLSPSRSADFWLDFKQVENLKVGLKCSQYWGCSAHGSVTRQ